MAFNGLQTNHQKNIFDFLSFWSGLIDRLTNEEAHLFSLWIVNLPIPFFFPENRTILMLFEYG